WRAVALAKIAPYCREAEQAALLEEAQTALQPVTPINRSWALEAIAHTLGILGYVREAIDLAETIPSHDDATRALTGLIPFLPESIRAEVFDRALTRYSTTISHADAGYFVYGISSYLKHVPPGGQYVLWCKTLHALAMLPRDSLLSGIREL